MDAVKKYRKVVEAEVYRKGLEDGWERGSHCAIEAKDEELNTLSKNGWETAIACDIVRPYIKTLEGNHYIGVGDYIITDIRGERYPCKPDIFAETYEKID